MHTLFNILLAAFFIWIVANCNNPGSTANNIGRMMTGVEANENHTTKETQPRL